MYTGLLIKKHYVYCLGYGANEILFPMLGVMMLTKLYLGTRSEDLRLFKMNIFYK